MGMRGSLGKLVQSALKTVGDIAETVTYVQSVPGSYDPATGTVTNTDTEHSLKAVVSNFGAAGLQDKNAIEDEHTTSLAVMFASNDLSVEPNTGDLVKRGTTKYKVKQITKDPAGASTRLIVERIG